MYGPNPQVTPEKNVFGRLDETLVLELLENERVNILKKYDGLPEIPNKEEYEQDMERLRTVIHGLVYLSDNN